MAPFFELRDPTIPTGAFSSEEASRVLVVGPGGDLERWLLGLASPPPQTVFVRGQDLGERGLARVTCAVGGGYLPRLADVGLGAWVARAAAAAERRGFGDDDVASLLAELGLAFLARTPLAHVPEEARARASLAAGLASNRPVLVADATTGLAALDRDVAEADAWERWCAGRDAIVFVPEGAATSPFRARGWAILGDGPHATEAGPLGWRVLASGPLESVRRALEAGGVRCAIDDGALVVLRESGRELTRVASILEAHTMRLREAHACAIATDRPTAFPSTAED